MKEAVGRVEGQVAATNATVSAIHDALDEIKNLINGMSKTGFSLILLFHSCLPLSKYFFLQDWSSVMMASTVMSM